jgi:hypothetical protein
MTGSAEFFDAVASGDVERVRRQLARDPGLVRIRDADGATALHHAAFLGHREIVTLLHDHGADINARDHRHDATPSGWAIHYLRELGGLLAIEIEDALFAIRAGDLVWARRLIIRHPALVKATDAHEKSLAEHARESGNPAIAELFA